jgi:tetratricopeptide (TPR) repeat protein
MVMAYWGEAMTYNHPLWRETDPEAAHAVLVRLAPTPDARRALASTEREAMYLDAVEALYGAGDKQERDRHYSEALGRLHEAYPEDDEARAFYALSILGLTNGVRDYANYERAASIVEPLFDRNPRHPGAAHYIIHSYDDPDHAELGLPAANAYADIAPGAGHAQHMTTHIFLALGMWDRVIENNILATKTIVSQRGEQDPAPWACGHYTSWQHYGHLQKGEFAEAETLMDACQAWVDAQGGPAGGAGNYWSSMRAHHLLEAAAPSLIDRWPGEPEAGRPSSAGDGWPDARVRTQATDAIVRIRAGQTVDVAPLLASIPDEPAGNRIMKLQVEGLAALKAGKTDEGLALLREAADREDALPLEFGPPDIPKPSRELLAEALVEAGRMDEARQALEATEARIPGRRAAITLRSAAQVVSDEVE